MMKKTPEKSHQKAGEQREIDWGFRGKPCWFPAITWRSTDNKTQTAAQCFQLDQRRLVTRWLEILKILSFSDQWTHHPQTIPGHSDSGGVKQISIN